MLERYARPVRYAAGDWLHPDDQFTPRHLERAVAFLETHHGLLQRYSREQAWDFAERHAKGERVTLVNGPPPPGYDADFVRPMKPGEDLAAFKPPTPPKSGVPSTGVDVDDFTEAHLGAALEYLQTHHAELQGLSPEQAWQKARAHAKKVVR
jgi:hypothetical protein